MKTWSQTCTLGGIKVSFSCHSSIKNNLLVPYTLNTLNTLYSQIPSQIRNQKIKSIQDISTEDYAPPSFSTNNNSNNPQTPR